MGNQAIEGRTMRENVKHKGEQNYCEWNLGLAGAASSSVVIEEFLSNS